MFKTAFHFLRACENVENENEIHIFIRLVDILREENVKLLALFSFHLFQFSRTRTFIPNATFVVWMVFV